MTLEGKTLFITGASRGIGLAIALRAARDGANVAIAAKTTDPHPKLPGTIFTAAEEVRGAGGQALSLAVDIRDEAQVEAAVAKTVETFGGIDILVNNASAISLTGTESTDMKRYDLMHSINTRGTFVCSKHCIPHLKKAQNPHVLNLSPPLNMETRWFAPHVAYTMAKFGMSMCVLGMAGEFRRDGIAVNALWPRTIIDTAALQALPTFGPRERLRSHGAQQALVIRHHPFTSAAPGQYRTLLERFFRVGNDQAFVEHQFLSQPMTNRTGPKRRVEGEMFWRHGIERSAGSRTIQSVGIQGLRPI